MNRKNSIVFFILISLFSISCNNNNFKINVSNIDLDIEFSRFDKDFQSINSENIYDKIPLLVEQYGDFYNLYNFEIIGVGSPDNIEYKDNVINFLNYCISKNINDSVSEIFENDAELKTQLTDAFKHYKYYFPNKEIPKIYTCISGFNQSLFTNEGYIGISLDKYLGKDYKLYKQLGLEQYMQFKMHKNMIPVDCMRAWSMAEFPPNDSINSLITTMIYEGRVQYFLNSTLPQINDTIKWGYTYQQFRWVNKHEEKVWDYLISEKLLFNDKLIEIKTFTGEASFTTPFHRVSAPRAGTWVGYQIVKSFMDTHKDVSLEELMNITDYMKIFNESRYNP